MFVCGRGLFIAGILNPVDVEAGPVGFENEAEEDVDVEVVADVVVDEEEVEKLLLLILSFPLTVMFIVLLLPFFLWIHLFCCHLHLVQY